MENLDDITESVIEPTVILNNVPLYVLTPFLRKYFVSSTISGR